MHANTVALESGRPTPGIILFTGDLADKSRTEQELNSLLDTGYGRPIRPTAHARLGNWLIACVISRADASGHHYTSDAGITVLFDGYLTAAPAKYKPNEHTNAELIASLYSELGESFLPDLRGSFVGVILDRKRNKALIFNDRQGSRPLFKRTDGKDTYCFAPQTRFLARVGTPIHAVNSTAVGEYLIRGCFYGTDTLFSGIYKIPQATLATVTRDKCEERQYWSLHYGPPFQSKEDELVEELDHLLQQATRRVLTAVSNPALLLSGGFDSRLMLAYLLSEGAMLPSFSYTVADSAGDDHTIARQVANHVGIPHEIYSISISDYQSTSVKEAIAADGRVQIIDAPSNRWEYIGSQYSSMFIGDQCFGWKNHVTTPDEALDMLGWYDMSVAPRIADWIRPTKLKEINKGIKEWRTRLIDYSADDDANNIKDKLYYTERLSNMLNGFSARRLAVAEQARPLLDEDVIAFISRVPANLRLNKTLARKLMQTKFASLHTLPYAKKTSVPWDDKAFIGLVTGNENLHRFILGELSDNLDSRLGDIFDQDRLRRTAAQFFNGGALPPLRSEWWTHIPGAWRFTRQTLDRVGTLRGLLRILQINLFLKN